MLGRRAVLLALLVSTSMLGAAPFGAAAGEGTVPAFALPPGTQGLLAAAAPDGSVVVGAVTGSGTAFYSLPAADGQPVATLGAFPFRAGAEPSALAAPRLAVGADGRAAVAFESEGTVRVAAIDLVRGAQPFEVMASLPGEFAFHPTVGLTANGIVVAYAAVSAAGSRVCVVALTPEAGVEVSRDCVASAGAPLPAVAVDGGSVFVVSFGPSATRVHSLDGGSLSPVGTAPLGGAAASLTVRGDRLLGVVASATGAVRVSAPTADLGQLTVSALPVPAGTTQLVSAAAADGRLVAFGVAPAGPWALAEAGLSQVTVTPRPGATAFAAVTDAFGLARVIAVEGPALAPVATTFSAGDATAVRVQVDGPAAVAPSEWASLRVTLTAVRLQVTVAGLSVVAPAGWAFLSPAVSVTLAPGDSTTSTVRVQAPPGAPPGSYRVVVTPAVLESSTPGSAAFDLAVGSLSSNVGAVATSGAVSLAPGATTTVGVQLTNRGQEATVTEVRATGDGAGLFVTPPEVTLTLGPGATQTLTFQVTAPTTGLPQADGRIRFDVRAADMPEATVLELPAALLPTFLPEIVVDDADLSAAPGSTLMLPARVVNHGNTGGFVTLTARYLGLPGSAVTGDGRALLVPAFGSVGAGIALTLPAETAAGQRYSVTIEGTDAAGGALATGRTLFGTTLPVLAVGASFAEGGGVAPGGTSTGTLTLFNYGNRAVTFSLLLDAGASGFTFFTDGEPSDGIVVGPWSAREVALTVRAPRAAPPGPVDLAATVSSDAGPPLVVPVHVEVEAVHAFGMRVLTPEITVRDPAVSTVAVEVALSSGSNMPETVAVSFCSGAVPVTRILPDGTSMPVDPSGLVTLPPLGALTVRALVPVGLAPGQVARDCPVTAETLSGLVSAGTARIVRPLADPRVADITVLAPRAAGGLHTVFANITNGGLSMAAGFRALLVVDGLLVHSDPLTPLPPGSTRLISFFFVPTGGTHTVAVVLTTDEPAFDADLANNEASLVYAWGTAPAPPGGPLNGDQALPAAASLSLLALIAVALTEVGKSTFISLLFLPLYVKLKPGEVLDQYLRGQIHGYIIANPGEHYNAIKEQLGVTNGALAYHLRVLEKSGYIRATRDGMYKRFYPVGVKIPKRRRLSSFQETIVKAVRDKPALSQKDLAELLGVSNQVINYHVKQLEGASIIRLERDGRSSKIFLGPEAPPEEQPAGAAGTA